MAVLRRPTILMALLLGLTCVGAGCDLTEEEEDFGPLLGSWQITGLSVNGLSVKAQLDAQYDQLVLTLRKGAESGEFFTIIGSDEGSRKDLVVQGTFEVDGNELDLYPDPGPQVEFNYAVSDSVDPRLRLSAEEGASEDLFLELIQLPIQGDTDRLELRLSKSVTSTEVGLDRPGSGRKARAVMRTCLARCLRSPESTRSHPGRIRSLCFQHCAPSGATESANRPYASSADSTRSCSSRLRERCRTSRRPGALEVASMAVPTVSNAQSTASPSSNLQRPCTEGESRLTAYTL